MNKTLDVQESKNYAFNLLAADAKLLPFLATEHIHFAWEIISEWYNNGDYRNWDDVEKRVHGFKRWMITKHNPCNFSFVQLASSSEQNSMFCGPESSQPINFSKSAMIGIIHCEHEVDDAFDIVFHGPANDGSTPSVSVQSIKKAVLQKLNRLDPNNPVDAQLKNRDNGLRYVIDEEHIPSGTTVILKLQPTTTQRLENYAEVNMDHIITDNPSNRLKKWESKSGAPSPPTATEAKRERMEITRKIQTRSQYKTKRSKPSFRKNSRMYHHKMVPLGNRRRSRRHNWFGRDFRFRGNHRGRGRKRGRGRGRGRGRKGFNYRCISELKLLQKMQYDDPRTPQTVPPRSDKIVMITAYSDEAMTCYEGHGTGCLFDNQHVLTAAHLFKYENNAIKNGLKFVVKRYDGVILGTIQNVWWPRSFSMNDIENQWQTCIANDIAVCTLEITVRADMVNDIYPVFGLAHESYAEQNQHIAIDGYPDIIGQDGAINGLDPETGKEVFDLHGTHGPITNSGINKNSLQSECFFSHGNSGGPAFLVDEQGHYQTVNGRPVLVGIAINLGGTEAGDSTVCTPMNPQNLNFISEAAGYQVDCDSVFTREHLLTPTERFNGSGQDKDCDIEMLHHEIQESVSANAGEETGSDVASPLQEHRFGQVQFKKVDKDRSKMVVMETLKRWSKFHLNNRADDTDLTWQ